MGNAIAMGQFANILPPTDGRIIAITLDNTSRRYDLGALNLGGDVIDRGGRFYLTMMADVKFWFKFNSTNAGTCDETAADAAAATPTFQANACFEVNTSVVGVRVRYHRRIERYLIVKGSGAGILRLYASSEKSER